MNVNFSWLRQIPTYQWHLHNALGNTLHTCTAWLYARLRQAMAGGLAAAAVCSGKNR